MMRVIGIDPGTVRTGYGIVDEDSDALSLVACGVFEVRPRLPIQERLLGIHSQLLEVLDRYRPSEMAVEAPFVARNVRSAMTVGEARAIALLAAAQRGIPVSQYSPAKVKHSITDYGGSGKTQVREMVQILLNLGDTGYPLDASDALAAAICHLFQARLNRLVQAAHGT